MLAFYDEELVGNENTPFHLPVRVSSSNNRASQSLGLLLRVAYSTPTCNHTNVTLPSCDTTLACSKEALLSGFMPRFKPLLCTSCKCADASQCFRVPLNLMG